MMRQEADILLVSDEPKTFANRNDRILVCLLCFAAATLVFILSSAFPFFSNVDEYLHFDLITQYSHGQFPRSFHPLKQETLDWIVTYASPEFLATPEQFPNGQVRAPLWKRSGPEVEAEIAATKTAWSSEVNFESSQPPLYYALASVWWRIGRKAGLAGIQSLYWIRFLNIPLIAIVVWMGYRAARMVAPERVELRIGVPLLIAFIPQNVFYAMNNDVLSPVSFGALFLCSLQWLRAKNASLWLGAVTGFAVAAAYLTKLSNLPLIAVTLVYGIAFLLRRTSAIVPLIAIGTLAGFLVTSEMVINHATFASEHNWFHR